MAKYLGTIDVTTEGFKGIVSNPQNRHEVNSPLFNSLGFDIEQYWLFVILIGIIVALAVKDLNDKY